MKRYWKYAKPYLSAFIIGPILMIVEVIGEVVMPLLLSNIIDNGIVGGRGISYIVKTGIIMIITALCMMGGGVGGAYFAIKASTGFANDLRKDLFRKIQKFSFYNIDQYSTGSLVTRLTNDITQVQNMIQMMLRMALRAPGMLIGALIMAFTLNSKLALVILCVIPLLSLAIYIILKVAFPRFNNMQKKLDALNTTTQENLTNIRVVKSFVRERYEEEKFKKANTDLKESTVSAMKVVIFTMPLMIITMNITTLAVVWFGGNQIIAGNMTSGVLTAFVNYVIQILMSLIMVSIIILNASRAIASARRINEILNTRIDLTDDEAKHKELTVKHGKIEFRGVHFKYYKNSEKWVLENINLVINPGETVGIIGSTGSGKSSLVQLIPRLYDADLGEVLVDDVNVRDYSLKNLRDGVGIVLQKNVLFSGTIKENLKWGNENADDEEIYQYAESAQAHGFITSFEAGYDTELGQGGVNLSGGQKQRLCIARALLKKPKILILDDSTSAVDSATEARIRENLNKMLKGTTKIIIAQRISSVINADKIVVLDDGKIVGVGTHEELLKNCETYAEIYYSQVDKRVTA
ncbi:ABC transporter ATP-binding protein [Thermoclostridium stercorarium subsp. stercorarium DSM 8532]|uniref:ABC transporter ATP-binding protein n=1 Tax=Thermoclostridium stercorarium (strain ATCC 35414 / DSM 8532 / NCIMB 11754) TaxID=1121335 RepID=L7VJD9_THES1|nr:ABC transporter ATP-binding protein [Thermoclostridium stercorarium]AGC68180.1 ABC transporter ATP-binding protein [Thermoclostridium stercorarium subsp. stercorarium DSM 8532]AGI39207.1 ABC transporter ATPase/permease subunit [Thermoclostridium stercorarium subsp. stercorarium DSM 8532]UZQ86708.1 ABC transporter ATP-binding protein/permease [Thermoclostridium stercorarium]